MSYHLCTLVPTAYSEYFFLRMLKIIQSNFGSQEVNTDKQDVVNETIFYTLYFGMCSKLLHGYYKI